MPVLEGDVAVVTGGGQGLGAAISEGLASAGARVIIADINDRTAEAQASSLRSQGWDAHAVHLDVADRESLPATAEQIGREYGDVSILVNNAGIAGKATTGTPEAPALWDRVIDVNLHGVYYTTTAFLDQLKRTKGRIVNMSSVTAFTSGFTNAAYVASKGGVKSLTQMLARELAEFEIRVNAVAPGYLDTAMGMKGTPHGDAWIDWHCPMKRFGEPHEIAGPVTFLVSPAASFVNGITLVVDGGYLVM